MRVPWNRGVLGEGEIVSVVDCPVDQVAYTQDRGRRRFNRGLVASCEENQQGLGEEARQGRLAEIASPGHRRLSQLLSPLVKLHCVLDVNRTLDRVRDRRLVAQRLILVVVRGIDRHAVDLRDARRVEERWRSGSEHVSQAGSAAGPPSSMFGGHPAGNSLRGDVDARLESQEDRAIHRAPRVAKVEDAVCVEIRTSVAVHVHAHLDDADQLHEVDRGLTIAVSHPDGPYPRSSRRCAFGNTYDVVAVLVDPTTHVGDDQRAAVGQSDRQRAERSESVPRDVDADRRYPVRCQHGSDRSWEMCRFSTVPWPTIATGHPVGGRGPEGKNNVK